MFIKEGPFPIIKPHAFPHAIPEHEPRVIDRDLGLVFVNKLAIHPDKNILITRVCFGVMGGMALAWVLDHKRVLGKLVGLLPHQRSRQ